jgi:hypothetical protein
VAERLGWSVWPSFDVVEGSGDKFGESSGLAMRRPPSAWERLRSAFMVM